ncbi:MAG: anthranilate phosphoribosyltransferase, partial [Anaerolineae bacterium]|nr:anthranilate phosphoribosyltransferase [Gemmatimonadaceae bacterium]
GGNVTPMEVRPSDLGIPQATAAELMGGDPAANAVRITEILENRSRDGGRAAVILNAGAALYVAGAAHDLPSGVESANRALGRGEGIRALERLREASAKEQ